MLEVNIGAISELIIEGEMFERGNAAELKNKLIILCFDNEKTCMCAKCCAKLTFAGIQQHIDFLEDICNEKCKRELD